CDSYPYCRYSFPDWLRVLQFHQLGHSSRVLRHGKKKTECIRHLLPPSEYWNTKPYEEDEVSNMWYYGTATDYGAEDIMYKLLPRGPRIRNEEVVYMKDFSILIAVWVIFLVLHIVKVYCFKLLVYIYINLFNGILDLKPLTEYFFSTFQVPVAVGVCAYEAVFLYNGTRVINVKWKRSNNHVYGRQGGHVKWRRSDNLESASVDSLLLLWLFGWYSWWSARSSWRIHFGSIVSTARGFASGASCFRKISFFDFQVATIDTLQMQVSSTTANFMMIFSSSMSVIQYYLLGHFPVPYGKDRSSLVFIVDS
ncbi:hypothetical protein MTR67_051009, partial [Solanum verrucosum]